MELDSLQSLYFPKECNIDMSLFYPIASKAYEMDCMVGYFTSGTFSELARSISAFLKSDTESKLRIIASPQISEEDRAAMKLAVNQDKSLIEFLFPDFLINEDCLRSNTVKALSYLIAAQKVEIKIALQYEGMFHIKTWLFNTAKGPVAIHGSSNSTANGLSRNTEQLRLERSWRSEDSMESCELLRRKFEKLWSGGGDGVACIDINNETLSDLKVINDKNKDVDPQNWMYPDKIQQLLESSLNDLENTNFEEDPKVPEKISNNIFKIYDHQKKSLERWAASNYLGIFKLATGSGKTITSIYGAVKIFEARKKKKAPLFLIIAVPYLELADQWIGNLNLFNIYPIECYGSESSWRERLHNELSVFRAGKKTFSCLVVVNKTLQTSSLFMSYISRLDKRDVMFIGDECHRHSSININNSLPDAEYRMGLSATPFNDDADEIDSPFQDGGKERLINYYGDVVSEYGLDEAINDGILTQYNYHIVPVYLTSDEQDEYNILSEGIRNLFIKKSRSKKDKNLLTILCGRRSRLLGSATNKLKELKRVTKDISEEDRSLSLFYTGEGAPFEVDDDAEDLKVIDQVCEVLHYNGWSNAKFTGSTNKAMRKSIMKSFKESEVDALVAMKVLDEGIDVPACDTAYILSSTRNPRQYVQRRGRILRKFEGKKEANIYDFVILPLEDGSYSSSLKYAELKRINDFMRMAKNKQQIERQLIEVGLTYEQV